MTAARPEPVWGAAHLVSERSENLIEARLAVLDQSRAYRYLLEWRWAAAAPMVFIMLNPSVADAMRNDPTIRRCAGFARRERCGGLVVANLFALRSPRPAALAHHPDPVGPDNDRILCAAVGRGAPVVAAWGSLGTLHGRDRAVTALLATQRLYCLGLTSLGHPRHPLYTPAAAPLTPYESPQDPA